MIMRNSKTINLIYVFICVVLLLFIYKYWNLSNQNYLMESKLLSNDETIKNLLEQKSYYEKLNAIDGGKLDDLNTKLKKQDEDVAIFKRRFDEKNEELEKQIFKNNELKEALLEKESDLGNKTLSLTGKFISSRELSNQAIKYSLK